MKRLNDLTSGQDVVVKDAKIIGNNGLEIIKDNDASNYFRIHIQSTADGFTVKLDDDNVMTWDGKFHILTNILIDDEIRNVDEPTNKIRIGDDNVINFQIQGNPILQIIETDVLFEKPLILKHYTTVERPTSSEGAVIYDSTLKKCILYNGTAWVNLDGTALA